MQVPVRWADAGGGGRPPACACPGRVPGTGETPSILVPCFRRGCGLQWFGAPE